jgi:hypothetical protein
MQHSILQAIILFSLTLSVYSSQVITKSIQDFKWENRILIINLKTDPDRLISILKEHDADIQDRQIYWFILNEGGNYTNYAGGLDKEFYNVTHKKYFTGMTGEVLLVGKDGYIKERYKGLNLNAIFELIDSMPMRQLEMWR